MNNQTKQLLMDVRDGKVSVEEAMLKLKTAPFEDIGFAKVDLHRKARQGMAEVIYGAGKTPEQIISIAKVMQENQQGTVLITRLSSDAAVIINESCAMDYHSEAKIGIIGTMPKPDGIGKIVSAK